MSLEHLVGVDLEDLPWTAIEYRWTVDATAPLLQVEAMPQNPSHSLSATFQLGCSKPSAHCEYVRGDKSGGNSTSLTPSQPAQCRYPLQAHVILYLSSVLTTLTTLDPAVVAKPARF